MVQIIDENPTGFLNALGGGLARGAGSAAQLMPYLEQLQRTKQEQASANKFGALLGVDLKGLSPEMQKTVIAEKLKGQEKDRLLKQKQDYLSQLIGQGDQQQTSRQMSQGMGQEQAPQGQQAMQGGFNPSNIPDDAIVAASAVDPNVGRALQHLKDVGLREARLNKEMDPEYQRQKEITASQAKSDIKFNEQLQDASKLQHIKTDTLKNLRQLNKKGVTGKPYEKALERFGLTALTSAGRREFAAEVKNLITDIRSILGGQFSNFEFQTILNAYPSADFSKDANDAILNNLEHFQDIRNQEIVIGKNLKKENQGKLPSDFQAKVNDRLSDYVTEKMKDIKSNTEKIIKEKYNVPLGFTLMIDPTDGEYLSVPDNQVENLKQQGAMVP